MNRNLVAMRALFGVLLVVVTYLTVTPNPDDIEGGGLAFARWIAALVFGQAEHGDKIAHFGAYGALGLSLFGARMPGLQRAGIAVAALAVYGAALEGVQGLGPERTPDALDAVANASGAAAGYFFGVFMRRAARTLRPGGRIV